MWKLLKELIVWADERSVEHDTATTDGWWEEVETSELLESVRGVISSREKETINHYCSACVPSQQGHN